MAIRWKRKKCTVAGVPDKCLRHHVSSEFDLIGKYALTLLRLMTGSKVNEDLDARVWELMENGRYIPELDHGIPNDVSWQNYCYYAQRLGQLIGAIPWE